MKNSNFAWQTLNAFAINLFGEKEKPVKQHHKHKNLKTKAN